MSKAHKVESTNAAVNTNEIDLSHLTTTSAKIRFLHNEGKTTGEIAKILNKRYQHVRNVLITPIKKTSI